VKQRQQGAFEGAQEKVVENVLVKAGGEQYCQQEAFQDLIMLGKSLHGQIQVQERVCRVVVEESHVKKMS
jgi:hypothetical protein